MAGSVSTLHNLFRLAFSGPLNWLSSPSDSQVEVRWATLNLDEAQAGDVLIIPAEKLTPALLAQAEARQLAALVVLGEAVPLTTALPIVAISGQQDLHAAHRLLLTILINQRAAWMERGVRVHKQLTHLALSGAGLNGLAGVMSDLSGKGVVVQDKRLGILAESVSSALGAIWQDVLRLLLRREILPASLQDRKQAALQTVALQQGLPGGLERLIIPITVGEVARGYLSLVGIAGELDALDCLVAEQGALVCAEEMARAKSVRETEKRLKGDLLTALLQDNLSVHDARLWAQSIGADMAQAYVAMRFAWDAPAPPSRRRLETLVNGEAADSDAKPLVNPLGGEVICFCVMPPSLHRPEAALTLGQAVLAQGEREYPDVPIRCGIGAPALDLSHWRTSFRQAGQALELARRFNENKPLYFPDLAVYRLLLQIEHNPELAAFHDVILGNLLAHENGRELIHTLEVYFTHHGNLSQAAEALFIHRNTLLYRMERIASITGLDLDDPETRLAVQLALHIERMRGSGKVNSSNPTNAPNNL
jgi:purine catabolism regulator